MIRLAAPAKINLRLKIEGRQNNGYHNLSMLNVLCDLADEVAIGISTTGHNVFSVEAADRQVMSELSGGNSLVRAANLLQEEFSIDEKVSLVLRKNIPIGAGLGGGSSDAAAVLKAMCILFEEKILGSDRSSESRVRERILKIALQLGSDVPFFFSSGCAVVHGVGEVVEDLDLALLETLPFILIMPEERISTADIYADLRTSQDRFDKDDYLTDFVKKVGLQKSNPETFYSAFLSLLSNDLESFACKRSPLVRQILGEVRAMPALQGSMSGSGSAVFALPKDLGRPIGALIGELRAKLSSLPVLIRESRFIRA